MKSQSTRERMAKQTVEACERGWYLDRIGRKVSFSRELQAAMQSTMSHPEWDSETHHKGNHETRYSVTNETTLQCARRLVDQGEDVVLLNFASAKHPGGGFLRGSIAQEESLALCSGLYPCINGDPMYRYHARNRGGIYSDWAIYSPDVPVIRDDVTGEYLDLPWVVSMITCPAVNKTALRGHAATLLEDSMRRRISKVLTVGSQHDTIILGAWGCGIFGQDPAEVSLWFEEALDGKFKGTFEHVAFAVLDNTPTKQYITPFEERFGE